MQKYQIIEGEQKSDDWQKLREGLITGSVAKKVKGTGNAFLYETLAMMTTVREVKQAYGEHVDRGNELEPDARKAYEKATGEKVKEVAFVKNGRYGISPDGLVYKKDKLKKFIEIKSPDTNNHIRYIIEGKIPSEHIDQIIHGFIIFDDVDEADFISYDPKFKYKPLLIINVKRSSLLLEITTAKVQYQKFIEKLDKHYSTLIL